LDSQSSEAEVEIKNEAGLHMRPAMKFVDIASGFKSKIKVSNDSTEVDGKSIMEVCMLVATVGTRLKIRAQGPDSAQAVEALRRLVEEDHFNEPLPKS